MNISIDGGALCSETRQGTSIFSSNLIDALGRYDNNDYTVYTFCDLNRRGQTCLTPTIKFKNLTPKIFWMKGRVSLEEILNPKDIFLALNQALPAKTSARIISFSHGLSFYYFPQYYQDHKRLDGQLKEMVKRSSAILVSSKRVADEFITLFPGINKRIFVIPFGIPFDCKVYNKQKREKFFMCTAANNKNKNIDLLVDIFTKFKEKHSNYKLYLIGPHNKYSDKNIITVGSLNREALRDYYRRATGYLTASYYESFNFPVLEALSQQCAVIGLSSAIIPEMAEYCNVVKNIDEFIGNMKKISEGNFEPINLEKLRNEFSWKKYVEKLIGIYSNIN